MDYKAEREEDEQERTNTSCRPKSSKRTKERKIIITGNTIFALRAFINEKRSCLKSLLFVWTLRRRYFFIHSLLFSSWTFSARKHAPYPSQQPIILLLIYTSHTKNSHFFFPRFRSCLLLHPLTASLVATSAYPNITSNFKSNMTPHQPDIFLFTRQMYGSIPSCVAEWFVHHPLLNWDIATEK